MIMNHKCDGDLIFWIGSDLVPGHGFRSEERAGEFNRQPFLVVLGFVLGHAEKDCSGVGGWGGGEARRVSERTSKYGEKQH